MLAYEFQDVELVDSSCASNARSARKSSKAGAELRKEHEAVQPQDDLKNPALITWQVGPDLATLILAVIMPVSDKRAG
jgi:hypothetical protein